MSRRPSSTPPEELDVGPHDCLVFLEGTIAGVLGEMEGHCDLAPLVK